LKKERRRLDNDLCVFCKAPAEEVHHLDYQDVRLERLRSLCRECHAACTAVEYGQGMQRWRIDPCDPINRPLLLHQIELQKRQSRPARRWKLLRASREFAEDFFEAGTSGNRE
jgi:hypothetical protein